MHSPVADPSRSDLVAVDIPSGRARTLKSFDLAATGMDSGCTVSPDGRTMHVTTVRREEGGIYLAKLARQ
jgi:Tol biopolymer transport system component